MRVWEKMTPREVAGDEALKTTLVPEHQTGR